MLSHDQQTAAVRLLALRTFNDSFHRAGHKGDSLVAEWRATSFFFHPVALWEPPVSDVYVRVCVCLRVRKTHREREYPELSKTTHWKLSVFPNHKHIWRSTNRTHIINLYFLSLWDNKTTTPVFLHVLYLGFVFSTTHSFTCQLRSSRFYEVFVLPIEQPLISIYFYVCKSVSPETSCRSKVPTNWPQQLHHTSSSPSTLNF